MQNPWFNLPDTSPFVLADDEKNILEYNKSLKEQHREDRKVHLEVLPE
jgi:hypothetical protein